MDRDALRQLILNSMSDLAIEFWSYNHDVRLTRNLLQQAVKDGVISVDEMAQAFRDELLKHKRAAG